MYTAAVLTEESVQLLHSKLLEKIEPEPLGFIFETKAGQKLPHHMTISMGDSVLNSPKIFDESIQIYVHKFLYNENVCCAVVDRAETETGYLVNCSNENPHITMCLRPPTRPVESNNLFTGRSSSITIEEIILTAYVEEIK